MPDEIVLDSSAVLAVLKREPGAERVRPVLGRSAISAVNVAEVQSKMVEAGQDRQIARDQIRFLGCETVAFDEKSAFAAGSLIALTRRYGLSLGDCACLALAMERGATVYTADRVWKELSLGVEVEVIR